MARAEVTGRKPDSGTKASPPCLALSISEFCEAHRISPGMFYKMKRQGLTPREMKVGSRTLITLEAAAEWRVEREAASAFAKAKTTPVALPPPAPPTKDLRPMATPVLRRRPAKLTDDRDRAR